MHRRVDTLFALSVLAVVAVVPLFSTPVQACLVAYGPICPINSVVVVGVLASGPSERGEGTVAATRYEIHLGEGWNLISFPDEPVTPEIDALFKDSRVSIVLSYDDYQWTSAVRDTDGWKGNLKEVHSGRGYWVNAESNHGMRLRLMASDGPPVERVRYGWNLLGPWAPQVPAQGTPMGDLHVLDPSDDWGVAVHWKVAYTYDPSASRWTKVLQGDDGPGFVSGQGYWVWLVGGCGCF